jgi:hypothetical protein
MEDHAVIGHGLSGHLDHLCENGRFVAGDVSGEGVGVRSRTARVEGRQQHATFENELVGIPRHAQASQPALDHIQGEDFLGSALFPASAVLQI